MRLLALGDIVGQKTIEYLRNSLWKKRTELKVDFVIANGENVTEILGISDSDARQLLDTGIDIITTGNHIWGKKDIYTLLDDTNVIIRPANFPSTCPGHGYTTIDINGYKVLILNLLGNTYMTPLVSPFETADKILNSEKGRYDLAIIDFHAESTSEKIALARYLDGRATAIFGTHTHVQTADERVLPKGTGFITDLGMSGPTGGIIGSKTELIMQHYLTRMPMRNEVCDGPIEVCGAVFDIDGSSGKTLKVERVRF